MSRARELEPFIRIALFILGGYFQGQEDVVNILDFLQADPEMISAIAFGLAGGWYAIAKWTGSPK